MSDSILFSEKSFKNSSTPNWLEIIERQVRATEFGSIEITIHDGRVVQIETSVKVRFDKSA